MLLEQHEERSAGVTFEAGIGEKGRWEKGAEKSGCGRFKSRAAKTIERGPFGSKI